jgi:glucose/arabinose dehydrogenase
MCLTRLSAGAPAVFVLAAVALTGFEHQGSPANRPWPPGVQEVPDHSPLLSPIDALKTFYMPPGYHVELVASEPLIQEPVAIDWDPRGRLWAVEMPGYMNDIAGGNEHDPIGRIVVLADTNHDGRMDTRTVFADGLVLARAIKVLDRGVLVGEPPNVWLMRDDDGDLRMDTKTLVTAEYGRRDGDPQNNANGFYWALDNRIYTAGQVEVHLRLKNGALEVQKTLARGEWGVAEDDAGRIYRNTNESALHVDLVPTAYFARNPNLLRTRGSYERLATDNEQLNTIWPVRPNPGTNRAYQTGINRADGSLARFTAVCAPLVYRGDRLPAELYGNVFVAEPAANLVSRIILSDAGATLRARKAYDRGEFLASTDERFRPVYLSNAPDGTLYVVDLYRGILEHRISLTTYLRDYIIARKLTQPMGFGRIYRVVHDTTRRDTSRALSQASPGQLAATLSHPNGWWRDTAQRLLVERGSIRREGSAGPARPAPNALRPVIGALVQLAGRAKDSRTRLHALWTLDGIDAIEPATVTRALEDASRDVRVSAIRIAERWLGEANHPIQAPVLKRLEDVDWAVRRQVAASLGALPAGPRETAAISLLERHGDDPITMDAALSGLRGSEAAVLEKLIEVQPKPDADGAQVRLKPDTTDSARQTPQREAAITMLAAIVVRSAQDAAVQDLFVWTADERRPQWQRSALLRGAEVALLGTSMPGSTPGRRSGAAAAAPAALPCPTCPGGRAGTWHGSPARECRSPRTEAAVEQRTGGALRLGCASGRSRFARKKFARARGLGRETRGSGTHFAADGRRVAALRRRARGLQEHVPGLSSAGWARPGQGGAESRRLATDACASRYSRAHSAQRQGGRHWIDAVDWLGAQRRSDRRRVDLRPARVGSGRRSCRSGDGESRPCVDGGPDTAVDGR